MDMLAEDAKTSLSTAYRGLCTCALLGQGWLAGARARLYAYVWLDKLKHHLLFSRTVSSNPDLGALVLQLRSHISLRPRSDWRDGSLHLGGPTQMPMAPNAVKSLVNLESLVFVSDSWTVPNVLMAFMTSFVTQCHVTLRAFALRNFKFMSFGHLRQLVQPLRRLESLQVWRCMWMPDRMHVALYGEIQPLEHIKTLDVRRLFVRS